MPVVSNTSPVFNLAVVGRLSLLKAQFGKILIPPAVEAELAAARHLPGGPAIGEAEEVGWIGVAGLGDSRLVRALSFELDDGEAAAIALALELGYDRVLMDEHDGRARAKAMGLQVTGVLGVLLRARREGSVDSVRAEMERLRSEAGFFIAPGLFQKVLVEAGEH